MRTMHTFPAAGSRLLSKIARMNERQTSRVEIVARLGHIQSAILKEKQRETILAPVHDLMTNTGELQFDGLFLHVEREWSLLCRTTLDGGRRDVFKLVVILKHYLALLLAPRRLSGGSVLHKQRDDYQC